MFTDLIVTSTRNRYVVEARKLSQRKHRQRQGQFLVEGLQLLHMALDAGGHPIQAFYCPEHVADPQVPALLARLHQAGVPTLTLAPQVMQALSQREVSQGIVATFALFETTLDALALRGHELVVVLDRLQDPGNMGTLIRTADAVGAAAVVLIEPCVDPFDPKTVRGSMGSLFNVPLVRTADVPALFAALTRRGLRPVGTSAHDGKAWGEGILGGGVAMVLGNEVRGLSKDVGAHIHHWAHLPMVGKAESLNVAVAGSVLMYAWLREEMRRENRE